MLVDSYARFKSKRGRDFVFVHSREHYYAGYWYTYHFPSSIPVSLQVPLSSAFDLLEIMLPSEHKPKWQITSSEAGKRRKVIQHLSFTRNDKAWSSQKMTSWDVDLLIIHPALNSFCVDQSMIIYKVQFIRDDRLGQKIPSHRRCGFNLSHSKQTPCSNKIPPDRISSRLLHSSDSLQNFHSGRFSLIPTPASFSMSSEVSAFKNF